MENHSLEYSLWCSCKKMPKKRINNRESGEYIRHFHSAAPAPNRHVHILMAGVLETPLVNHFRWNHQLNWMDVYIYLGGGRGKGIIHTTLLLTEKSEGIDWVISEPVRAAKIVCAMSNNGKNGVFVNKLPPNYKLDCIGRFSGIFRTMLL